ncbi:MAG: protein FlhF [Deltaproteobacteria bacterium]|nr:protein FlhF [Deltaproteobacteria bacterium]
MQTNIYRAKTIKEATARVKNSLGPDAMIISTKRLRGKGENDLFEISAVPGGTETYNKISNPFSEVNAQLMSIKEMMLLLNHSDSTIEKLMVNPAALTLYAKLIREGVDDHYARNILERTGALKEGSHHHADNIKKKGIKELMNVIDVTDPFEGKDNNQIIAALIGTTGVGKTTTIAKLAAQLMLKAKKKVGLISIDTYRIGAIEQLKTYANILGIPCFQAFKRKDLLFALRKMEGRDVVLIDTAGRSQYDRSRIEELKTMIAGDLAISSHLLLSVGTVQSEMLKTAISFGPLKFQTYIFTKIDEAERFGSIINQIIKLRLPISYITTGQNVPEDIERADKRNILNLLLNKN